MISFALYNLKGGVGKTTSCINLAYLAAAEGHRTLLWDLDAQSASTFYLEKKSGLKKSPKAIVKRKSRIQKVIKKTDYPNLHLIPGDHKNRKLDLILDDQSKSKKQFRTLLKKVKKKYDYVFFDCPPTLNLVAENIFRASNFILLPTIPTTLSERTFHQILQFFEKKGYDTRKVFPFFTLVDRRKKLHHQTMQGLRKQTKDKVLRAVIPYSAVIERMGVEQAPLPEFAPNAAPTLCYRNLWQEMKMMQKYG